MKGFVYQKKNFEADAILNREPVQLLKGRGYVLTGPCVAKKSCSRVLDILESVDVALGCTEEKRIAIVQSGCYECVNQGFCNRVGKTGAKSSNVLQLEKCCFGDVFDVCIVGEGRVENDTQIFYLGNSGCNETRDRQIEMGDFAEGGRGGNDDGF